MAARAWRPTLPVLHWMTRYGMEDASLEVGEREFEVGRLQAAIDLDDLARDVGAGGGDEVEDRRGDVIDVPEATQRGGVLHGGTQLVARHDDVQRRGGRRADADGIDPDAGGQVAGGEAGVLLERALDGAVADIATPGHVSHDRRDADDGPARVVALEHPRHRGPD